MSTRRYRNPVYSQYFADPFVWRHGSFYYAVGTGRLEAESRAEASPAGVFTLLRSKDLVEWCEIGRALEKLDPEFGDAYWAPEVAYAGSKFWMYYSVGRGDKAHHLRVASADAPDGPFRDTGALLTDPFTVPFAIDASPFQDEDGQWYLFYARDFLDSGDEARSGTGVVVDRLLDMTRLEGNPRTVVRARFDWQRFLADRVMYGARYDWHTIEGPFVCKRNGRYWCLFSAGRWENESYGVDWAVADHPLGPWRYDGTDRGARLLRTVPGRVLGPGHNCVVTGPDGITDYIVYHAWDPGMSGRRMCIDELEWTTVGPRTDGPTVTPRTIAVRLPR